MQSISRSFALSLILLASVSLGVRVAAADAINTNKDNVAIEGYDTVAYFSQGEPVEGSAKYAYVWQGAIWYFASAEHRDLFAEEPERYAPRYGGFCAGAMALGQKVTVDPEAWTIIDGKLYLTYAKPVAAEFTEQSATAIPKADANWDRLSKSEPGP